jgi:hypothetical protein
MGACGSVSHMRPFAAGTDRVFLKSWAGGQRLSGASGRLVPAA